MTQFDLFDDAPLPEGLVYEPEFLSPATERELIDAIAQLPFARVEMRGAVARRRTVHFGWTYGYESRTSEPGAPMPAFLLEVRERAADWAGLDAKELAEALVTEYTAGAPIGWHRDAPMFGEIIGLSLGAPCRMKFRPYVSPKDLGGTSRPARKTTHQLELQPRSAYLMRGVVRRDYEHSIPPVEDLRYSITFRTLRPVAGAGRRGA